MSDKNYYEYKDIMEVTGKSYSAVKKWRISIERLSGYEFKKVKIHVTRKHVKDHYQFTEEEFEKFIKLSKRIDETKNITGAILKAYKFLLNSLDRLHKLYLLSDNLTFHQNSRIIKLLNFYIRVWSVSIIA